MSEEEGLKAFEAALASLVPRTDRLDRDRLMFLAGQASVAGVSAETSTSEGATGVSPVAGKEHGQDARATRGWAWPVAFSAMTAVAATLLVLLLTQPGPPMIGKGAPEDRGSVESPVAPESPRRDTPPAGVPPEHRLPDWPESPRPGPGGTTVLALGPIGRVRFPEVTERLLAARVPQALDRVFAEGAGPAAAPQPGLPSGVQGSPAPATYRKLRDDLLQSAGPARSSAPPSVHEMLNPIGDKS